MAKTERVKPKLYVYTGDPQGFVGTVLRGGIASSNILGQSSSSNSSSSASSSSDNLIPVVGAQVQESIHQETDAYSITPDTFQSRSFLQNEDSPLFLDAYAHGKNSVTRFGLNSNSKVLQAAIGFYNSKDIKEKLELKSFAGGSGKGGNSPETQLTEFKATAVKILTQFERDNTKEAIAYLQSTKQKTALVDIFERNADNKINLEGQKPNTHTVVLYEQGGKYLIIDPSNASFSTLLAGAHDDIRVCPSSKFVIYKAAEKPTTDGWRDCIDIATKLAFSLTVNTKLGLSKLKVIELANNTGYIDFESLRDCYSVKEITNQKTMYPKLHNIVLDSPVRMKQSSDMVLVKKSTLLITTLELVSDKINTTLKHHGLTHLSKDFTDKEKTMESAVITLLVNQSHESSSLDASRDVFSRALGEPLYGIVKDDIVLMVGEYECIDTMVNI